MSRLRKSFLPFSWNPVAIIFTQGTSASINLASYLKNDRNYPITYSLIGTLQSGVTHSNGTVTYNGAGGAATTTVQFRATSGSYVADSAATVSIVATQVNRAPVWDTPSGSVGTFAATGGTRAVQLSATDPDGDPVTYSRTGSAADTAPGSFAVTLNGLLTIPENVAASTYTVEVRASDGLGGQAARQFTATVQAATSTVGRVALLGFENLSPVNISGLGFKFTGTDGGGTAWNDNSPLMWGGKAYTPPFYLQEIANIPRSTGAGFGVGGGYDWDIQLRSVTGPQGTPTRALYSRRTTPYTAPQQLAAIWRPSSTGQGMFFIRYWMRWLTGWKAKGGSFWEFAEAKNNTSNGDLPDRVNWSVNPEGDYAMMMAESFTGGTWNGASWTGYKYHWLKTIPGLPAENAWFKVEAAARFSTSSALPPTAGAGWSWMALTDYPNGVMRVRTLDQAGKNIPDANAALGRDAIIGRLFNWLDYHNGAAGREQEITGIEIWDRWPTDASTHPSNFT